MIVKWATVRSYNEITRVDCESETEAFVTIRGRRTAKVTHYHRYHDSWEEAHAHLLERTQRALDRARDALATADADFLSVVEMKKPQDG
ncbi:MAG TPA: hypothetical protein VFT98_20210 [Myxococcota bacterium]|nr:hypothetical protein [Myxococcota bacterium]